jgi:hypothetical protein
MKKKITQFLKVYIVQNLITFLALSGLMTLPANAQAAYPTVEILSSSSETEGTQSTIEYCTNAPSFVTVGIYKENADKTYETVKILEENSYKNADCYTVKGEGTDGTYYYGISMQGIAGISSGSDYEAQWLYLDSNIYDFDNSYSGDETTDSRLRNVYVTKSGFDMGRDEESKIVFSLSSTSNVKITLKDPQGSTSTIFEKSDLEDGTYSVSLNSDNVSSYGEYSFKIEAANSYGSEYYEGSVLVEKDEKTNRKPNIYYDQVDEIPFEPRDEKLKIIFSLDKEADVSVIIREGNNLIAEVKDAEFMDEGYSYVYWDGKDSDGEYAENGVYEYKITAENDKGKDVEYGKFSIEDSGNNYDEDDNDGIDDDNYYNGDEEFEDVSDSNQYYDAIMWAYENGIFEGNNGYFRPKDAITRAEALKVIIKTLNIDVEDYDGEKICFEDLYNDGDEWYMPYIKTGMKWGIINGYPDNTFRPNSNVNRIEALVMLMRAAEDQYNLVVCTNNCTQPYLDTPNTQETKWYVYYASFAKQYNLTKNSDYFYPSAKMTREEMAYMLYRLHKTNLID